MKTILSLLFAVLIASAPFALAADPLSEALQKGLFEEEANHNLDAAIQAYRSVVAQVDAQRKLAATAVFRLGECHRKLGQTNEAVAQFRRVVAEFADQPTLATLSRQNLIRLELGPAASPSATPGGEGAGETERVRVLSRQIADKEFELVRLTNLNAQLFSMSRSEAIKVLPTVAPDLLLNKLLEQQTAMEQKLASLEGKFGGEHPEVKQSVQEAKIIGSQIEERLEAILKAMKSRAATATAELASLRTLVQQAETSPKTAGVSSDEEEKEIRRIRALIQDSPDLINAVDGRTGRAPLHHAAESGYARVVSFLLDSGAEVNLRASKRNPSLVNVGGWTALHFAANSGHKAVVDLLLNAKAGVSAQDSSSFTPLHLAAARGFRQIVERLLAAGADVNARNFSGMTPLHRAVEEGHQGVVELLFAKGADVKLPTTQTVSAGAGPMLSAGSTPLHTAMVRNHLATATWLCQNGADVNAVAGEDRLTPLHLAANQSGAEIISTLLRSGANLEATDANGQTALARAVANERLAPTAALLDAGAALNVRNNFNQPLLHMASRSAEMLRLVLARKPDLEVLDGSKITALVSLAGAEKYDTNLIAMLLEAGANPTARYPERSTPLHGAAGKGRSDLAELLLRHGADVNAVNETGATPLTQARNSNYNDSSPQRRERMVALLLAHGADQTLLRRASISVSRRGRGVERAIFLKGTNDWNRHSLYELIAFTFHRYAGAPDLPFPDLRRIEINRLASGGKTTNLTVDLEARVARNACTNDVWLEWGDVVEVPEKDHLVQDSWAGFTEEFTQEMAACLSRKLLVVIKDRTNRVDLNVASSQFHIPPSARVGPAIVASALGFRFMHDKFTLRRALQDTQLLLTSSDLARVRVRRLDPITREPREWTLDVTKVNNATDFWLRDGDMVEVPDLPPGGRVTVEEPRPSGRPPIPGPAGLNPTTDRSEREVPRRQLVLPVANPNPPPAPIKEP